MKRDLSIDTQQVNVGDSSTLTLTFSKELKTDSFISEFQAKDQEGKVIDNGNPQSLYLIFDNLTEDRSARIEFTCTIEDVGKSKKLTVKAPDTINFNDNNGHHTIKNPILNDIFRRITPITFPDFSEIDKATTLTLSWEIDVWDTTGSYTIEAFVASSNLLGEDYRDLRGSNTQYRDDQVRKSYANKNSFGILKLRIVEDSTETVRVSLQEARRESTPDQLLWMLIRNRTVNFAQYRSFIDKVMCSQEIDDAYTVKAREQAQKRSLPFSRAASYSMLKFATEFYLMQEMGLVPPAELHNLLEFKTTANGTTVIVPATGGQARQRFIEDSRRTGRPNVSSIDIIRLRDEYLERLEGGWSLPYFNIIRQKLAELPLKNVAEISMDDSYDVCYGILPSKLVNPPLLELLWSYWHEEGGLVQTMNALSLRFQNVRRGTDRDPLANLAIDPLRPLSNLLWGYIEDERNRLTINRRNLEYQYEYGISLIGKAIQNIPVAEHRTNFLRGFHELLRAAVEFYQQANFTTIIPDGFPLLNHLREVHLMLAEGAHNQYGDLPWATRVEMLTQQWILARPEVREFLGGRVMVPYTEPWMDRVDNMKQLQGWNPTNITHFRDLGVFGEQLLLSIRYGSWNDPALGGQNAANWAQYWRAEIQRYIHAYKAVTGVDLASDVVDARVSFPANEDRYQQPALLIERQVTMQQNGQIRPKPISAPSSNGQLAPNGQLIRREYNG